jgi:hypothetical protein
VSRQRADYVCPDLTTSCSGRNLLCSYKAVVANTVIEAVSKRALDLAKVRPELTSS